MFRPKRFWLPNPYHRLSPPYHAGLSDNYPPSSPTATPGPLVGNMADREQPWFLEFGFGRKPAGARPSPQLTLLPRPGSRRELFDLVSLRRSRTPLPTLKPTRRSLNRRVYKAAASAGGSAGPPVNSAMRKSHGRITLVILGLGLFNTLNISQSAGALTKHWFSRLRRSPMVASGRHRDHQRGERPLRASIYPAQTR